MTGTHYPYIRPVYTARMYGPYVRVSKMHRYIRAVNTARIYRCSVHTTRIELLFCTGRIYGPYIRVSKIHPYVRAVHTARIYGPYLRVVRFGLYWPVSRACRWTAVDQVLNSQTTSRPTRRQVLTAVASTLPETPSLHPRISSTDSTAAISICWFIRI